MGKKISIQTFLENLIESKNVYFQPPENVKIKYPCLVYDLDGAYINHADNSVYDFTKLYTITLITKNPDDSLIDRLLGLPLCTFDRSYRTDYLNHYVFSLYY